MSISEAHDNFPERPLASPSKDSILYRWVSRVLIYGMMISFVVMLVGMIFSALLGKANANVAIALSAVIPRAAALDPLGIAALGVLVLALTPGISVLTSLLCFARERDLRYALVCLGVLVILALSITLAL